MTLDTFFIQLKKAYRQGQRYNMTENHFYPTQ